MSTSKQRRTKKRAIKKTDKVGLDTAALDASIGYSLHWAQLSTRGDFLASMEKFSVRPSQLAVLMLIRSNPGATQSAICSTLRIQKANFVALLDGLEIRGLTERRKISGDRRFFALYLTKVGELFVAKLESAHAGHDKRLCARLGEKRSRQMLTLLHKFSEGFNDKPVG